METWMTHQDLHNLILEKASFFLKKKRENTTAANTQFLCMTKKRKLFLSTCCCLPENYSMACTILRRSQYEGRLLELFSVLPALLKSLRMQGPRTLHL